MRFKDRQQKVEQEVYDCLDELASELSIDLPYHPDVWWMGKKLTLNQLHLSKRLRDELKFRQHFGISYFIVPYQMVMIGNKATRHSILEESAHAFHFICSGLSYHGRDKTDKLILASLVEMIGFLGARLLGSDLENPYEEFPDLVKLTPASQKEVMKKVEQEFGEICDFYHFFVHQQGYGLADRIYFRYLAGEISIDQIRKMFLSKFDGKDGAIGSFQRLKNKFWLSDLGQVV